ncbi:SusC/RagA family TonB-linked outer membrane protein [Puia dinghuensis]|uniref:SusC/RagA family TonB-linked outer membrane protein n=1 Tax=Puia dinghuensis TaxID=1792502 RepID=A0A8J2XR39_9BACT|nr:SusC/RagA family TonB-linked outer membrane protein [Puia dinghuensis]GGA87462.1 SusC/RagA family TonB-linked outer membrane protein [Puia dinghuensis]
MTKFESALRGCFLACCCLFLLFSQAQQGDRRLRGTVKGPDGNPLVGATVALVTDRRTATATDATGAFTLSLPAGEAGPIELEVSSVGFETRRVSVQRGQYVVAVTMDNTKSSLNEVVVTALGINREKKSLGYAVTTVKGDEFTTARENNIANALTGKVAGVNAAGLSTGPGGSSRVTIRGNGTLGGDNQPLYVVNGMPIDNSVPGGAPTVNGITNNVDRGDGIAGINPDDIESISVLKGGTASALYGSRAANGVILITTKKGRAQRGVGVEYNSTATLENVAVIPDFQYTYGQGLDGVMSTDLNSARASGRKSWGALIDGNNNYVAVDGQHHSYTAKKDNLQNFYQTGSTFTNSIAFAGGNEKTVYRFSAADLNSNGILPKTTYDRKTLNLSLNSKLTDRLGIEALAQYNLETGVNRTGAGDALGNPNWTPLEIANTADVRWLKPGYDSNGNEQIWNDAAIASNGYFVINKYQEKDTKNRFIGQASVSYELVKNLVIKGTASEDFYNYNYYNILPTGTLYIPNGQYTALKTDVSEFNGLVTASYKTALTKDIGLSALAGANSRKYAENRLTLNGLNFTIPYFYSFSNLASQSTVPYSPRIGVNSIFGSVDLDFKSLLFLTFAGREDWFSTLSPQNNHIFYPSVGGSFILSDAVHLPDFFTYAKLRGSWAQVGGGAPDPYQINLTYSNVTSSGPTLQNVTPDANSGSNVITNPNLKPYTSTTYEGGLELQMLKSRLGIDFTYYNRQTTNDIVNTAVSTTSGYSNVILNIGELRNSGVELLLTGKPVRTNNFSWNVSYNVAYNANKVVALAPGLPSIQIAASVNGWATLQQIVGQPFGTLVGTRMTRDAKTGLVVFNRTTHTPVMTTATQILGNSVAPYTMGLTNDFKYKRFTLSILLDGKFGNKIFSIFELYATRMGKLKSTLPGRAGGLELKGVDQTGAPYDTVITQTNGVLRNYYDNYKTYSELFLHDGSFIKLRQVILTYQIPVQHISTLKIQSANISFVARNLFILYRQTHNFDPEQSFTSSNAQGFESIGLPRTRSYGLNLSVKF